MEQKHLSPLAVVLKWSVLVLLGLDALVTLTLPWWLGEFFRSGSALGEYFAESAALIRGAYPMLLAFLLVCGVCGFCMLMSAFCILKRMVAGVLFDRRNARGLRHMGYFSLLVCGATVVKLLEYVTLYSVLFLIVFLFAALFLFVLSELFERASEIQEENSLMI